MVLLFVTLFKFIDTFISEEIIHVIYHFYYGTWKISLYRIIKNLFKVFRDDTTMCQPSICTYFLYIKYFLIRYRDWLSQWTIRVSFMTTIALKLLCVICSFVFNEILTSFMNNLFVDIGSLLFSRYEVLN